jgi:hypothetical protein
MARTRPASRRRLGAIARSISCSPSSKRIDYADMPRWWARPSRDDPAPARHNPELGPIESVFRLAARHRSFNVRRCECAGNLKTCWTKPSSPVPLWKLDAPSQRRAPSLRLRGHAGCGLDGETFQSRYGLPVGKTGDACAWRARCRKHDNRMPAVYLGR